MNDQITSELRESQHSKVKVAITDIDGILRGKYISMKKFMSAQKQGFGFCNVVLGWDCNDLCYDNVGYTGWHSGYPDAQVNIDLDTKRNIPWEQDTPFFLGHFVTENQKNLEVCPRGLLINGIEDLKSLGFNAQIGLEFEWFNFAECPDSLHDKAFQNLNPISPGMFGYSLIRASARREYFHDLMDNLSSYDIPLEGIHTETGPGVYEAAIAHSSPLKAADRGVLFKTAVKEIALSHDIVPTFMARWNDQLPGSSGHIHQSLMDLATSKPLFYDASDPHHMSETFKHYLAGLIKVLPEILPLFAPNINSYKRLVEGFWAPTRANWGIDNRTTAFRVIPGSESSTRLEARIGGADINPYLAIAACLKAGAYGIRHKIPLDLEPIKGNGYADTKGKKLPSTLEEASLKLKNSSIARELLGDTFVDHFANTRLWEWQQHKAAVTDWELKRYFEII